MGGGGGVIRKGGGVNFGIEFQILYSRDARDARILEKVSYDT